MTATLRCPECGAEVWDGPHGHKLAKCWNSEAHASGGTLAFDTMDGCAEYEAPRWVVVENTPGYLPDDDDPATFATIEDARAYAFERAQEYANDPDGNYRVTDDGAGEYGVDTYWIEDLDRTHDLGRVIEVLPLED